jgi:hypothetical protein
MDREVAHGAGEVEEALVWVVHMAEVEDGVAFGVEEENQYLTVQE